MSFPPSLQVPGEVLDIARQLESAGFEAWCVGGAVRDALLGDPQSDFDIATSATPEEVQKLFRRTVPVGVEFGTVGVLDRKGVLHEITTFRRDVSTDGRRAIVAYGATLEEDLARRDFTINAIAYHPVRHDWKDPFEGAVDLERKRLRAVGTAAERFHEDYLRILRGIRFAARFEFAIEPETWAAAVAAVPGLKGLSAERVRDEWFKGLRSARSVERLAALWWKIGAAPVWLPELLPDEARTGIHALQGGGERLPPARRDPVLLTMLLCRNPAEVLTRLRCSNADIARARNLARAPAAPASPSAADVRRWLAAAGSAADDLLELIRLRSGSPAAWAPVVAEVRHRGDPLSRTDLAIRGEELVAAGVPPGPAVGRILAELLDRVLEDPARNTREALLALTKELL